LPYARDIVAREDAARAALGQGETRVSGTLRFTAPSTFAQLYIAPILPDYTCVADTALWLIYPQTNVLSAKVWVFMDFLLDRIGRNPAWEA